MFNFNFYNPTKILFGKGQIAAIANEIPKDAKVLITYGGGSIKKNGVLAQVTAALGSRQSAEFGGIEPNPTYETLMKAVELIRKENFNFLLAVGGGSVLDGTKFIAAAVNYNGDPWDILLTRGQFVTSAIPMGTVLTLPATGSEMNNGGVITRVSLHAKLFFGSAYTFPKFSVLDPETTYSLPVSQVGNGVVDSFVHILEQYLTFPVNAKVQDRFAEGLLLTLIEDGPKVLDDPQNYDLRATIMWVATMALNGLIGTGVPQDWATHMIGHEITALHGVDHGKTLAIVMPSLLEQLREQKKAKLLQYAERVWGITTGSEDERVSAAISKTRVFFETMKVKTHLSDYQIAKEDIPAIIEALKAHGMVNLGEKQNITPEVSEKILQMSL